MSHDVKLGQLLDGPQQRDAVHVAIAPVIAAHKVLPGEHVGFFEGTSEVGSSDKPLGVIDPFLVAPVRKGEQCYLFLYPQTITSLRHDWIHPAFPNSPDASEKDIAKARFAAAAQHMGRSYEAMLCDAETILAGDYINNGEDLQNRWYEIDRDQFWKDYETLTGIAVDRNNIGGFTCSC